MENIENVVLIRYSEIFLKGKNFGFFEKKLYDNIVNKLQDLNCEVIKMNKRFYVQNFEQKDLNKITERLLSVFGICSISPAVKMNTDLKTIDDYIASIKIGKTSFRVTVNRADKRFPLTSIDYSKSLGSIILNNNSDAFVYDVGFGKFDHHQMDFNEKRENGIKYASCGLIWKNFGLNIINKLNVEDKKAFFDIIDKNIVN